MRNMDALSIRYNSSHSTDREHACAGDSYVSSAINVACPTTQRVFAIASPQELHGSSSLSSSTGTRSFCCNHQYSITAVTTSTGSIAERYAYSAYGQPTILDASASVLSSSAINNRYTYTGREWDATLGLHHFRARWMSPSARRFLTRDPMGFDGGSLNIQEYCHSKPFIYIDPTGMQLLPSPSLPVTPLPPVVPPVPGPTPPQFACIVVCTIIFYEGGQRCVRPVLTKVCYWFCPSDLPPLQPNPIPDPKPPQDPPLPPKPPSPPRSTCSKDYPGWVLCSGYAYANKRSALTAFPRGATARGGSGNARQCGAGGGDHFNVYSNGGGTYLGSIICCNCCEDSPGGAVTKKQCNVQ
jgi:RHS repeat-associated protein